MPELCHGEKSVLVWPGKNCGQFDDFFAGNQETRRGFASTFVAFSYKSVVRLQRKFGGLEPDIDPTSDQNFRSFGQFLRQKSTLNHRNPKPPKRPQKRRREKFTSTLRACISKTIKARRLKFWVLLGLISDISHTKFHVPGPIFN